MKPFTTHPTERLGQKGLSQLGLLLSVLILGVATYIGMQVVPFFIYFYDLEGHFDAQAQRAAYKTDVEMREFLEEQIRKMKIPVDPKELIIRRNGGEIRIELEYTEILVIDFGEKFYYELYEFDFHPKIIKSYKK